ncbi:hypothetical protein KKG45_14260 [bacterium]|nr:hypothetical protein [bacterium]MBU1074401.1 hypothetical protein [bacterium]MBU1675709.1 hypothetical protein [bacterium]
MRKPWNHLTFLVVLQLVVFLTYWRVISLPLWSPIDFEILLDADILSNGVDKFFLHLGNAFSQPLLQLGLMLEYRLFGLAPAGYLAVNLVLHGMNAFVVYLLVYMLFPRERLAMLASLLFALSVGHYGKIMMSLAGFEPLMLAFFYLVVLYCLMRNDFHHGGRLRSPWYLCGLGVFLLAGLTKPVSFSILGSLVAYRYFFYKERGGRALLPGSLVILIALGVLFYVAQRIWGYQDPDRFVTEGVSAPQAVWYGFKNIFRYLNLMLFPLQISTMLESSHPILRFIYEWRVLVRSLVSLGIISFSFFGLVFGGRAVRFFIAWTYITVLPFTIFTGPLDWLNIKYLYLASIGFCVILSSGTVGCVGLLRNHRWRRLAPLAAPLLFVLISNTVATRLIAQNRHRAKSPATRELHRILDEELRTRHARAALQNPPPK